MNFEALVQRLDGHLSRWIIAAILLPPVVYSMWADEYMFFFFLILVIGGLTWWEFSRLLFGPGRLDLFFLALVGWLAVAVGAFYGPTQQSLGLVLALALGSGYTMWSLDRESGPVVLNLLSRFALGHIYLSFLLSFFILLKKTDSGGLWLIYVLVATAAADTAAFYVGRRLKGPRLWPKISPHKTVSGLLGGVAACVLISAIFAYFLPSSFSSLVLLGFFLALWGAMGDLFESAIKRALDIKDSSRFLLGHGGFWDRLDSLLFNVVPVYAMVELFQNTH
ncbi:MAG: phosphatidate cytidylyltransferase [Deltaproteobacteria bacterium]|nr:phosphatidate cytidylyltransferase [Deltaproteobacteria bacterium]